MYGPIAKHWRPARELAHAGAVTEPDPALDAELRALLAAHADARDPRLDELVRAAEELVDEELAPYRGVVSPERLADLREDALAWTLLGPLRPRLEVLVLGQQISGVVRKDGAPVGGRGSAEGSGA